MGPERSLPEMTAPRYRAARYPAAALPSRVVPEMAAMISAAPAPLSRPRAASSPSGVRVGWPSTAVSQPGRASAPAVS